MLAFGGVRQPQSLAAMDSITNVLHLLTLVSLVLASPVPDAAPPRAPVWNTDLQRTEPADNEFPMAPEPRQQQQQQSMRGQATLVRAMDGSARQKAVSTTILDTTQDVILHQYLDMVPAMQPEPGDSHAQLVPARTAHFVPAVTPSPQNYIGLRPSSSRPEQGRGDVPRTPGLQPSRRGNSTSPAEQAACQIGSLLVTVRRGGCKKRVNVRVCRGMCPTTVEAMRRPPFLLYRPTCCRARNPTPLMVDMNDSQCVKQRRKKRKARLTGYSDVLLLMADSCECALCL